MGRDALLEDFEKEQLKSHIPDFRVGDTIRVSTKIVEGDKERVQSFQGTVIARKGRGLSETFSLHRVSYGEGMERVFTLHSPRIVEIQVMKHGDVRRAKLYNLRGTSGKAAKVKERIGGRQKKRRQSLKLKRNKRKSTHQNQKRNRSQRKRKLPQRKRDQKESLSQTAQALERKRLKQLVVFEEEARRKGFNSIAGVDEAGAGTTCRSRRCSCVYCCPESLF